MPKSRQKKIKAVDPFCPGNRKKFLSEKEKELDQAPKNVTSQDIPRSLKDMMEASKMVEQRHKPSGAQKVGSLQRKPKESHSHFMTRVRMKANEKLNKTRAMLQTEEMISRGRVQGEAAVKKRKKRIAELQQRKKGKHFERTLENQEKDFFKDHVEFGEVASAPPIFSVKPRKSSTKTDKPGSRELLLTSMLNQQSSTADKHTPQLSKRTSKDQLGKFKKRKNMTNAEKRNFDRSRDAAILAYRKSKGHELDNTVLMRT